MAMKLLGRTGAVAGRDVVVSDLLRIGAGADSDLRLVLGGISRNHARIVRKEDVAIAKNYLSGKELDELNRIVGMYLDYAENQAKRQVPMTMADWATRLDAFLQFNEYAVLKDAGHINADIAKKLAEKQFDEFRFRQDQDFQSDFDEQIKQLKKEN